ncbi:MAG: phosphotransferase [Pseudomonadota bacterium]
MTGPTLFIRSVDEITRDWVSAVLATSGAAKAAKALSAVQLEPLNGMGPDGEEASRGYMSTVIRVHIRYRGDTEGEIEPATLVVKLPPQQDDRFAIGAALKLFAREMHFYRDIAPGLHIGIPKCYLALGDGERGGAVCVLEDGGKWQPVEQTEGMSVPHATTAVDMIAKLHARWWNRPELHKLDWLPDTLWGRDNAFEEAWPGFIESYASVLSPEEVLIGEQLAALQGALQAALDQRPQTFIHGDFRAGNMFVDGPDPDRPILIFDWQVVARGMGATDPARLICGSLPASVPPTIYREFAVRWHAALVEAGVAGYTQDEAWDDFRLGFLQAVYAPVCFHANADTKSRSGRALFEALARRMFRTVRVTDALSLLKQ